MLLLGIDLGTSSVKLSVMDGLDGQLICSVQYPEQEVPIISERPGWAEQSPETWWAHIREGIKKLHRNGQYDPLQIRAIGIAYQMHGLVVTDQQGNSLRNSIIWCDSRAIPYGEKAFHALGAGYCLGHLLNAPGNFTAAKLAWVKEQEPALYKKIRQVMLPGDFISMKLTGVCSSSISALSEGICWDFKNKRIAEELLSFYGFDPSIFPRINDVFSVHGHLQKEMAEELGLKPSIPVSYKAGDQPNTAFALQVMQPGELAANAGTSGVIYAVTDELKADPLSRINQFAHVNHTMEQDRIGVLLCINGCGISNRWMRNLLGDQLDYAALNEMARQVKTGTEGLYYLPFGNGAERMLENKWTGAGFSGIDLNKQGPAELYSASLEGIAFSFRYGLDIMRGQGIQPSVIRAAASNMFLSDVFTRYFVNATGVPVELFQQDGSAGAALGAGIGAGLIKMENAFGNLRPLKRIEPDPASELPRKYEGWKQYLQHMLDKKD